MTANDRDRSDAQVFSPPGDPDEWAAFRDALVAWRQQAKAGLDDRDDLYRGPELSWSAANYCCCFLMLCDETFYDWRTGRYTWTDFSIATSELRQSESVVLWHAYPRIRIDERNQFDYYRRSAVRAV